MTTYYGVWSEKGWNIRQGGEWWRDRETFFYTSAIGLAKAQAMVSNSVWEGQGYEGHWEACAIGEDGLPKPVWATFEPFCLACMAWLELPKGVTIRDCPSCGRTLRVAYRGRSKTEKEEL